MPAVQLEGDLSQGLQRRYAGLGFYQDDPDLAKAALKPKPPGQVDGFWDVVGSGVRQGAGFFGLPVLYQTGVSQADKGAGLKRINAGFNPFEYVPDELKEPYAADYFWANTPQEVDTITQSIRLKQTDDERLKRNGFGGLVVRLGGGVFDPMNLLPLGGVVKTSQGVSLLKSGLMGAAVNTGVMAVSEVAQQAAQMKTDFGEAALNIGGAALIGGLLGTGGAALAKQFGKPLEKLGQQLEKDLVVPATMPVAKPVETLGAPYSQFGVKPNAKSAERSAGIIADALRLNDQKKAARASLDKLESKLTNKAGVPDVAEAQRVLGSGINKNRERLQIFQGMIEAAPDDLTRKSLSRQMAKVAETLQRDEKLLSTIMTKRGDIQAADDLLTPVKRSELNPSSYTPDPTIDLMEPNAIPVPEHVMQADMANPLATESAVFKHLSDVVYDRLGLDKVKDEALIKKLWLIKDQDPVLRTILSPSAEVRNMVQDLVETPLKYEKNYSGIATSLPVESLARQGKGLLGQAVEQADNLYTTLRKGGTHNLNPAEWREAVAKAMRRADDHVIPEVAQAAKTLRRVLFEPLKERAIKIGALPENVAVDTADSYLIRVYDREKIVARRPEFEQINYEWLALKNQMLEGNRRSEAQLRQAAQQIVDRIIAQHDGRLPYDLMDGLTGDAADLLDARARMAGMDVTSSVDAVRPDVSNKKALSTGTGKPFKRRVYDIPDEAIEDFLINDAYHLAQKYERTMSTDLALMEKMGTPDLDAALLKMRQSIRDDYARLREGVTKAKDLKHLDNRMNQDDRDMVAMWQRLRGVYGLPQGAAEAGIAKVGRVLGAFNYLSLMGNVTISSLADAARPLMVHGLKRYLVDGLAPIITDFKSVKLAARETQLAGTAWDLMLDTRMAHLSDFVDEFGGNSRFDRGLNAAQSAMGRLSLISPWTQAMKQWAGVMTQTRILDVAEQLAKGKAVSEKELAFLSSNYIDRDMAKRIVSQVSQHGETHGSVRIANTGLWDDADAVTVFRAGLGKEVDKIIVTPGADKPLLLSTWWGKMLLQFKSFFFASTQRVMLSGLQDRNLGTLAGLTMAAGLGAISTILTDKTKGKNKDYSPVDLIAEGLDKSGAVGWLFDINNAVESLSRGHYGLSPILGKEPMSRYQERNVTDAVLGPTGGRVEDMTKIGRALATGDFKRTDVRAMRRLLPMQNLFYARFLFDQGEKGLNSVLGVDED
jgi:hypothetical protein